jgi:energy-coupling factor transporter transmembrane protein EcfT
MNKQEKHKSLYPFIILMGVGIIGSILDGIAFQIHVGREGVSLFSMVPAKVWTSYLTTFPGDVLTCLWLCPLIIGFLYLSFSKKKTDS